MKGPLPGHSRLALRSEVATQTHRYRTGDELGQTAVDDNPRFAQRRQAGGQGEGDGKAVRETDGGIRDDPRVDLKATAGMTLMA